MFSSPESRANMRISPMEAGDHSGGNGKRARGDEEVKPEEGEVVMQDGDEGRNALAVVEAQAPMADQPQMDLRMDVALLHCQACLLPLKPPVFKVRSLIPLTRVIQDLSAGSRICLQIGERTNLFSCSCYGHA
jgi:hypothetical protein